MFHKIFHNACHRPFVLIQTWTFYSLCVCRRITGGRESAKMNRYPVVGGRNGQKRFEFISKAQTALVSLGPPHYRGFTITLSSTPPDKWSAHCWNLHLITHNTHKRQASMPLKGLEPTIPASEQPQTHALDHVALESPLAFNHFFKDSNSIFITFFFLISEIRIGKY